MLFNLNKVQVGQSFPEPSSEIIRSAPGLLRASLDTAFRFGGELTRQALSLAPIVGDKKYTSVDVKVHMLMKGQCPAIPGWHTDGVPRINGRPQMSEQLRLHCLDEVTRFHLLVTGNFCQTGFLDNTVDLAIESSMDTPDLYKEVSNRLQDMQVLPHSFPPCTMLTWDWWNLHTGMIATANGWRYLIRIAESNDEQYAPQRDLSQIIRTQQMVYSPLEFGW